MGSYNVTGLEITENRKRKCYLHFEISDDIVYINKGTKDFIFSRKELDKIFIKEYKLRKARSKNE